MHSHSFHASTPLPKLKIKQCQDNKSCGWKKMHSKITIFSYYMNGIKSGLLPQMVANAVQKPECVCSLWPLKFPFSFVVGILENATPKIQAPSRSSSILGDTFISTNPLKGNLIKRIKHASTFLLLGEYYIRASTYLHFLQKHRQERKMELQGLKCEFDPRIHPCHPFASKDFTSKPKC